MSPHITEALTQRSIQKVKEADLIEQQQQASNSFSSARQVLAAQQQSQ